MYIFMKISFLIDSCIVAYRILKKCPSYILYLCIYVFWGDGGVRDDRIQSRCPSSEEDLDKLSGNM